MDITKFSPPQVPFEAPSTLRAYLDDQMQRLSVLVNNAAQINEDAQFTGVKVNGALRIFDSTDTDFASFSHDGVDFNTVLTNTTQWDISGADVYLSGDNQELRFGVGNDMQIYSDGVNGVLTSPSGAIFIGSGSHSNASVLRVRARSSDEAGYISFNQSNNTRKGFFGWTTSATTLFLRNEDHGGEINLSAEDAGGTPRAILRLGSASSQSAIGFHNTAPIIKPTVTGSRGGNVALASLLTALANYGLITDNSTA